MSGLDGIADRITKLPPQAWGAIIAGGALLGLALRSQTAKKDAESAKSQTATDAVFNDSSDLSQNDPVGYGSDYYGGGNPSYVYPNDGADGYMWDPNAVLPDLPTVDTTTDDPSAAVTPPAPVQTVRIEVTSPSSGDVLGAGGGPPSNGVSQSAAGDTAPKGYTKGPPRGFPKADAAFGALGIGHKVVGSDKTKNGDYVIHDVTFKNAAGQWIVQRYHHYTSGKRQGDWQKVGKSHG